MNDTSHGTMLCQVCATKHEPYMPHNAQSLYYGMAFKMQWGVDPTWADAMAHCTDPMKEMWTKALIEKGQTIGEVHAPAAADEQKRKEEFCARFKAEMLRIVGQEFSDGGSIADYADAAAPSYWDERDDESPEECASTDISYWEAE